MGEYPVCKECEAEMYYDDEDHDGDWVCPKCGYHFPDYHDGDPGD